MEREGKKWYPVEIDEEGIMLTVDGKSRSLDPMSSSRAMMLAGEGGDRATGPIYQIEDGWGTHPACDMWVVDYENKRAAPWSRMKNIWPDPCFECLKGCICGDEVFEEEGETKPHNCPMPEAIS